MDVSEPGVLVVDDESQIRALLRIILSTQRLAVLEASDGAEGIQQALTHQPALIILDLGLPDMDGLRVLTELRTWTNAPVLVLSARADERDKVGALDAGANDYVSKPFSVAELLARVRVLLRQRIANINESQALLSFGPLQMDISRHLVTRDGVAVHLTRKEFKVLALLMTHPGRMVTQRQLLAEVWGLSHVHDHHYLRIVIARIRQKLGKGSAEPILIRTEPGVGYELMEE